MLHSFSEYARLAPDKTALTFLRDGEHDAVSLTRQALAARARTIAVRLLEQAPRGSRAMLLHPPGLEFCTALLACFHAGIVAVPCYPPSAKLSSRSGERFLGLAKHCDARLALTDASSLPKLIPHLKYSSLKLLATDELAEAEAGPLPAVDDNDLALIQYTSGSTGSPKGAMLTHANLKANLESIRKRYRLDPASIVVSWLPPYHDMGLINILSAIAYDYHLVMMEPRHFLQKPLRWLQTIDRYRADISGGPNFAYDLCASRIADDDVGELDLSRWNLAFCGAENVRARTLRGFSARFSGAGFDESAFSPCYGLAEATLMASARARSTGPGTMILSEDTEIVSCGSAGDDIGIAIVNPETRNHCEAGVTGEIWLQGKNIAQGYWNAPEASRDAFGNILAGTDGTWFRTGDLGFLHEHELYVNGRLKDLIVIRGRNHHPADLEEAVNVSHPSLELNACAAFPIQDGEFVIAAEIRREARHRLDAARVVGAMQTSLAQSFDLAASEIVLLQPGSLPRTTSGKISRSRCRDLYLANDWKTIGQESGKMPVRNLSDIEKKIIHHVADVLRIPGASLEPELKLGELGLDSLKRVELALILEEAFDVEVDAQSLLPETDLALLATMLTASTKRNAPWSGIEAFDAPGRELPMTPLQHAFLHPGPKHPESFLEIVYLRTPADLDVAALKQALRILESRFDALRLRFSRKDGNWKQHYGTAGTSIAFDAIDASAMSAEAVRKNRAAMVESLKTGFDLAEGPLVQAVWFDRGKNETGLLGLSFHHLVIDVISVSVFVTSLKHAYQAALSGKGVQKSIPEYGKWLLAMDAYAKNEALMQFDYWKAVCGEATDGIRSTPDPLRRWKTISHPGLSPAENRLFVASHPAPMDRHNAFLAALAQGWCSMNREDDALILLEFHGRRALAGTHVMTAMGWFVCRYPVRIPVRQDAGELLLETQKIMEQVPDDGLGYGLLMKHDRAMRELNRPRVKLVYRGNIDDGFRTGSIFPVVGSESLPGAIHEAMENADMNCHVELYVTMHRGQVSWSVQYSPAHCDDAAAASLADEIGDFIRNLAGACPTDSGLESA